ncbi:MAG: phenylpyruvate tautomerase MIF-related protein [Spirochaetales bacterium]|nr:phenylpyruvate tautomerase MIF-related protein [Spirochaetales bacterium]
MPCITVSSNFQLEESVRSDFQKGLVQIAKDVLSKPEHSVMILFDSKSDIYFVQSYDPALFIQFKSIGLQDEATSVLSDKICTMAEGLFKVSPERIYIEFANVSGTMWGWNKRTF